MKIKNFPDQLKKKLCKQMEIPFSEIKEIIYIKQLNHTNVGDHLIYLAEKKFFRKKGIQVKAEFNDRRFLKKKFQKIISKHPIIIRGGGYFGDLWYNSYLTIERIVQTYKNNKIIIMPQSLFFKDPKKLEKAKRIFNNHNDVTIFFRDKISYQLAKKHFKKNLIIFSPDSAFFLSDSLHPSKKFYFSKKFYNKHFLYLDREDKEKNVDGKWIFENTITLDWINIDWISKIKPNSQKLVQKAIDLFSNKELIITSRLHGAILASLLKKPYILLTNSYHKIESFYDSWLKDDPYCHLSKSKNELENAIKKYKKNLCKRMK